MYCRGDIMVRLLMGFRLFVLVVERCVLANKVLALVLIVVICDREFIICLVVCARGLPVVVMVTIILGLVVLPKVNTLDD